jgi:MFS family permease
MAVTRTEGARTGLLAGGIAAIVFAVLFVVGFLLVSDTPDGDESNLKWVRHFADSGNRRMIIIGVIMLALAAVAFLIFLAVLRERLRETTGSEWLATIVFASGIVFVAMVAGFAIGQGSVAASITFGDAPVPRDADIMRTLVSVGFGALLVFGAASAGLLIFVTSIVSGRAALLPRWFVVTGYVVGVIVFLGGLLFFPIILLVLWMLAIGIVMLSRSRAAA